MLGLWYTLCMQKKNRFCAVLFLFFLLVPSIVFAQVSDGEQPISRKMPPRPPRKDFRGNGRRLPKTDGVFSVIGVKIEEKDNLLVLSLYFNDVIDTNSVLARHILLNDAPIPVETEFLFNKARRMLRFSIPSAMVQRDTDGIFSLKLMYAKSFSGKTMRQTEITPIASGAFFKYSRKEGTWQKS